MALLNYAKSSVIFPLTPPAKPPIFKITQSVRKKNTNNNSKEEAMRTFGDALREGRKKRNLTLRKMSEAVGLSISYLSDIEQGRRRPPTDDLVDRIEQTLQVHNGSLRALARKVENIPPMVMAKKIGSIPKLSEVLMRANEDLTEDEYMQLLDLYESLKRNRR